jgi:Holliday junction resolvase
MTSTRDQSWAAMSKSKQKGTAAETAVVRYLQEHGFPYAERRALHGNLDKGDITGCGPIVFEVKDHAKITIPAWLKELEEEVANAKAEAGAVLAKKRGTLKVGEWYAIMPVSALVKLLKEAGY